MQRLVALPRQPAKVQRALASAVVSTGRTTGTGSAAAVERHAAAGALARCSRHAPSRCITGALDAVGDELGVDSTLASHGPPPRLFVGSNTPDPRPFVTSGLPSSTPAPACHAPPPIAKTIEADRSSIRQTAESRLHRISRSPGSGLRRPAASSTFVRDPTRPPEGCTSSTTAPRATRAPLHRGARPSRSRAVLDRAASSWSRLPAGRRTTGNRIAASARVAQSAWRGIQRRHRRLRHRA